MDARDLFLNRHGIHLRPLGLQSLQGTGVYTRARINVSSTSSTPVLPSVLPSTAFGTMGGFHRYQPVSTPGLLPGDAVSLRSEPSSRTALMGEQPNPWDLLQPQDAMSRHRTCLHHY